MDGYNQQKDLIINRVPIFLPLLRIYYVCNLFKPNVLLILVIQNGRFIQYQIGLEMNQKEVKIRALRDNFTKKHPINPENFATRQQEDKGWEEFQFCDRSLFHPTPLQNAQDINNAFCTLNVSTHSKSRSIPSMITIVPDQKLTLQVPLTHKRKFTINTKVDHFKDKPAKPYPATSKAKDSIRNKRTLSANPQKKRPNYAVYIMKPQNVSPIKMQARPISAFTKFKRQLSKNAKTVQSKPVAQKVHRKRSVFYLQPWETEQNEF